MREEEEEKGRDEKRRDVARGDEETYKNRVPERKGAKDGGRKKRDRLLRSECMNEGREEGEEEEDEEDWW